MSEDMLLHFSSNSSNQSDQSLPSKIAKLEARMVGKASLAASGPTQATWSSVSLAPKLGAAENLVEPLVSSDSDDDDNGGEFLIQANTQKRCKLEDDRSTVFEHVEALADGRQMIVDNMDNKAGLDVNRKKQSRGRGHSTSGRGRGSRGNDQTRIHTVLPSNGQLENSYYKVHYL
ncbi:unnamed protein product [Ilex paraguariensis]|uniref:Uncharacterized protein n=1 Tax=Ilex paraguariensis TaxID=185542 RepID=A0ABC8U672_9AQUA